MSRKCQVTKKTPTPGRTYNIRGIAKKKKGIGLNITGKDRRLFKPNLHKKRIYDPETGKFTTVKVSSHGLRIMEKRGVSRVLKNLHK